MQNSVNHRVFERKWRSWLTQEHVCLSVRSVTCVRLLSRSTRPLRRRLGLGPEASLEVMESVSSPARTAKQLLESSPDPYKALLSYRATPLPSYGLCPAELLMGRRIQTDVPQVKQHLIPHWPYLEGFRKTDRQCKERQKRDYEQRHRTQPFPEFPVDSCLGQHSGRSSSRDTPRSYRVEIQSGNVRRNRSHL